MRICTETRRYVFTIPNVKKSEDVDTIIQGARLLAITGTEHDSYGITPVLVFSFENEKVRVGGRIVDMHHFLKLDNYPHDTPSVEIVNR